MTRFLVLGSAFAVPDAVHDNTHFIVVGSERTMLVDCANNPIVRLSQVNIPLDSVSDLFLTHFHPDHVSGVAPLLMGMWLKGRQAPLDVYGARHTIDRTETMMNLYGWDTWPGFFSVRFHRLEEQQRVPVMDCPDFRVFASPVCHFVPTMGMRFEFPASGKTIAYSCDTEPCPSVVDLAAGADFLFHEANAASADVSEVFSGHSSAIQAGETARLASVKTLLLIHYPGDHSDLDLLVHQARLTFDGEVMLARDDMEILV